LSGPLLTYPGLLCLTLSVDTVLSSSKTNMLVPNCDYYYNIIRWSTLDAYGCMKCAFGYNGVVVMGSNFSYNGYLDRCVLINETRIPIEGKCDLN